MTEAIQKLETAMEDAAQNAAAKNGSWNYPTRVLFGAGRIAELPGECRDAGMTKPLLITDAGLAQSDIVKRSMQICKDDGLECGLFADAKANPSGANIDAGVAAYKAGGYDGVIAFGGGSGVDAAKAVALMVGQDRPIWDFEDVGDNWTRVNVGAMAPVIAVPTTAGTGSEVGRSSIITNEDDHVKKVIFHPNMLPGLVIADPELTIGLPKNLTAWTGVDAFIHSFEAWCAPGYHPMADGIALQGMAMIKDALPAAYADGANLAARADMLAASAMGATAFQKGLGGIHALAHVIGGMYDTQHGLTNAILWPYVMQHNRSAIEGKMTRLASFLGLENPGFDKMFDWVLFFRQALDIPHNLSEIGVTADEAEIVGAGALQDPSNGGNPVTMTAADYTTIFTSAVKGQL